MIEMKLNFCSSRIKLQRASPGNAHISCPSLKGARECHIRSRSRWNSFLLMNFVLSESSLSEILLETNIYMTKNLNQTEQTTNLGLRNIPQLHPNKDTSLQSHPILIQQRFRDFQMIPITYHRPILAYLQRMSFDRCHCRQDLTSRTEHRVPSQRDLSWYLIALVPQVIRLVFSFMMASQPFIDAKMSLSIHQEPSNSSAHLLQ